MPLALDHLVIAARTLDKGLAWCEATLGTRPDAGGRHAFMGTHNRVFAIGSGAFPRAYAEIIAIDPEAPPPTTRARWFDLDDSTLQAALRAHGPQLVHWVARCEGIAATRTALFEAGVDCGEIEPAERATPQGMLRWQISVRADGHRALGGAGPALIEWAGVHPTDSMVGCGVSLRAMRVGGWPAGLKAMLPSSIEADDAVGAATLRVELDTPRGPVTLEALRLSDG